MCALSEKKRSFFVLAFPCGRSLWLAELGPMPFALAGGEIFTAPYVHARPFLPERGGGGISVLARSVSLPFLWPHCEWPDQVHCI